MNKIYRILCLSLLILGCSNSDDQQVLDPNANPNAEFYIAFQESQITYDSRNSVSFGLAAVVTEATEDFSFFFASDFVTSDGQLLAVTLTLIGESFDVVQNGLIIDGQNSNFDLDFNYAKGNLGGTESFNGSAETGEIVNLEIISIDRENKIISGEFSFVATSDDGSETRTISNGTFNVEYL